MYVKSRTTLFHGHYDTEGKGTKKNGVRGIVGFNFT